MDRLDIFLSVVTLSLFLGVFLSPQIDAGVALERFHDDLTKLGNDNHHDGNLNENSKYKLGSDHAHALFYVNLNGSEYNFATQEFQLRSRYVHMENFRPHIVHKHAENVTWKFFLQTMEVDLNHSDEQTCISIMDEKTCGQGAITLNGERISSLDKIIEQGDNLAVTIPESEDQTSEYMDERLPKEYRPDTGVKILRERKVIPGSRI